ncbi:MAG: amidohydrolase family protein [Planctomycetia bacterium]|nr:amidohydrolase family protein [Planctomycetia bacterium]
MKLHVRVFALLGFFSTLILAQTVAQQPPSKLKPAAYAITNTTVVTKPGTELTKVNLVIRDGMIQALGADVKVPADAEKIDGKDLVIYPGFLDAGNTWGVDTALRRSESGPAEPVDLASDALAITKPDNRKGLTPEFDVATALKAEDDTANSWRTQGIVARLAIPDGNLLGGQSAFVVHNGAAPRNAIVKSQVAVHGGIRSLGGQGGYPSTLMGSVAHFRQFMYDAGYHSRMQSAYKAGTVNSRPAFDPALDATAAIIEGKLPLILEADSRDEMNRALDLCKEFNVKPILFGCAEGWRMIDRLKQEDITCIVRLTFPDKAKLQARRRGGPGIFDAPSSDDAVQAKDLPTKVVKDFERRHDEEVKNLSGMLKAGLKVSLSTHNVESTDKFLAKVRKVISEGVPAEQALATLTINPASLFGVDRVFGEIALGKPAHLVAFTGGKFNDEKAKVRYVFAEGNRFEIGGETKPASTGDPKERMNELKEKITRTKERMARGKEMLERVPENRRAQFKERMDQTEKELKDDEAELNKLMKQGENPPAKPDEKKSEEKKPEEKKTDEKKPEAKKTEEKKTETKSVTPAAKELPSEVDVDRKPKTKTGRNVLIKGATVLTVTKGNFVGDVLVQDGKIKEVGPNINAPANLTVIDAKGLFVMPGIIDTHSHFSISGGVNEGTLSIVPEVRVRDVVDSDDVQMYRALAGGVTMARLLHGSANCIGGQDAVIKLKYGEPAQSLVIGSTKGVKFALGENVKRSDGRFPNTRLGVEAVMIRAFTEAQEYQRKWKEYEESKSSASPKMEPRRDLRLEALSDILKGEIKVHSHCYRSDEILMLLRVADRFGFKVKSLQHVLEGYKIAAEIAAHGASCSTFSDWWAYKIEAFDAIPQNAALLQEAGVLVMMKSDSNELMRRLNTEAAKAMKYGGVSEEQALRMITINPATQLSLQDRTGSIEVGKDADLVIFNGHPLSGYARCEMTLVEGEVYFQREGFGSVRTGEFKVPAPRGPELGNLKMPRNNANSYALKGITVHPVSGPVIEHALVQIENGKIKAIQDLGKQSDFELPGQYTMIDAKGLHLYPGMIDSATILGLTELGSARETQDFSEGGDFQPDLRALIGINPDSELIPVTRANGVLTVVTRPTGATVSGQGAIVNLAGWTPQEMKLVDPFGLHIEFPASAGLVSGSPDGPPAGRIFAKKAREEKLKFLKLQFTDARRDAEAIKAGIKNPLDPRREAMLPYAAGEKPVIVNANRKADILEALKWAEETKVKLILSGGVDAWKVADELKKKNIPVLCGPFTVMPQESYDTYDAQFRVAARLHQAGVKYCIRSAGSTNTRNLPYEAALAVSYGLPAEEALKAVTLYPAQILGLADKLGSIEPGKMANLVITDGDMLEPTTQVKGLFISGNPVEPTSKQTKLYERYRERLQDVKAGRSQLGTK